MRAGRFHGFVVRTGEDVRGYVDRCPHMGVPLVSTLDDYLTPRGDMIACAWHGALFRIEDGACLGGPCSGNALQAWPVAVRDGMIVTGLSARIGNAIAATPPPPYIAASPNRGNAHGRLRL